MSAETHNVLFLCTGNSARSIIAESVINLVGRGRFHGYSAGSHPKNAVHPFVIELLERNNYPTDGLRPKSWQEFTQPDAPRLDFAFTVCDRAAQESARYGPANP